MPLITMKRVVRLHPTSLVDRVLDAIIERKHWGPAVWCNEHDCWHYWNRRTPCLRQELEGLLRAAGLIQVTHGKSTDAG